MDTEDFIERWHKAVDARDLNAVAEMLAEDVTFFSPAFFKPYTSRTAIAFLLSQVVQLLPDFEYVGTFDNTDGGIVFQFVGTLTSEGRDYRVEGVDIVTLDDDGRIAKFVVMIRPLSSLQALADEMKKRMAGMT